MKSKSPNISNFHLDSLESNLHNINEYFDGLREQLSWKKLLGNVMKKNTVICSSVFLGFGGITSYFTKKMIVNPYNKINEDTKDYLENIIEKFENLKEIGDISTNFNFNTLFEMVQKLNPKSVDLDSLISNIKVIENLYNSNDVSNDLLVNNLEYISSFIPSSKNILINVGLSYSFCACTLGLGLGVLAYRNVRDMINNKQTKCAEIDLFKDEFIEQLNILPSGVLKYFGKKIESGNFEINEIRKEVKEIRGIYDFCQSTKKLSKFNKLIEEKLSKSNKYIDSRQMIRYILKS